MNRSWIVRLPAKVGVLLSWFHRFSEWNWVRERERERKREQASGVTTNCCGIKLLLPYKQRMSLPFSCFKIQNRLVEHLQSLLLRSTNETKLTEKRKRSCAMNEITEMDYGRPNTWQNAPKTMMIRAKSKRGRERERVCLWDNHNKKRCLFHL